MNFGNTLHRAGPLQPYNIANHELATASIFRLTIYKRSLNRKVRFNLST